MGIDAAFRWSKKKDDTVQTNALNAYQLHQVNGNNKFYQVKSLIYCGDDLS